MIDTPTLEEVSKGSSERYWNVNVVVKAIGVKNAVPILDSICLIVSGKCNPNMSFSVPYQIGWHLPVPDVGKRRNINGHDTAVPFIINREKVLYAFFRDERGNAYHDGSCPWCDNIKPGEYQFVIQIDSDNGISQEAKYNMIWTGDPETTNFEPVMDKVREQ